MNKSPLISIIVAIAHNNVIGNNNQLIWHLPADLKRFKQITTGHHIVMGRKTWESIGKPLPGRISVVITRNADYKAEGAIVVSDLHQAIQVARADTEIFIIGGGEIYKQFLPLVDKLLITRVETGFGGDTFFPEIKQNEWTLQSETHFEPDEKNQWRYVFQEYHRIQ
ncbi:MAG: dihydrofolate reductase [Bacteroidetes bacterium]|nr:dihydrofolate reductase [Bacteroidota bacterium]MBU1718495.1 dihydrofolate reductase [Bacteroidota bacterium]